MIGPIGSKREHVVIIGGGFGGLACAMELGNANFDVTVINRRNHNLFQPLLYQVATAALSPADIAESIRKTLARYKNMGFSRLKGLRIFLRLEIRPRYQARMARSSPVLPRSQSSKDNSWAVTSGAVHLDLRVLSSFTIGATRRSSVATPPFSISDIGR
jgi:choline dehydrogenase-like flavoprotein